MIALLLVGVLMASGWASWWSWSYQRRVLRVRSSHLPRAGRQAQAASPRAAEMPARSDTAAARVAIQQMERAMPAAPSSVLGWEAFSLASTLVFDGTVLLGCRRRPDGTFPDRPTPEEYGTLVLLIGVGDQAVRAVELLEGWRASSATLHLRPTRITGAIELFDERHSAIRAALLSA